MRPSRRQGVDPDIGSMSAASPRRGSRPTSWACRPLVVARTDAESARLITTDVDERDRPFIEPDSRTPEGFYRLKEGTGLRSLHCPRSFLCRIRRSSLVGDLASRSRRSPRLRRSGSQEVSQIRCSRIIARRRSTGRRSSIEATIAKFQHELGAMGYKFQFVTSPASTPQSCDVRSCPAATAIAAWRPIPNCRARNSPRRRRATPRRGISARSAPAISTRSTVGGRRRRRFDHRHGRVDGNRPVQKAGRRSRRVILTLAMKSRSRL